MNLTVIAPTAATTFAPVTTSTVAGTDWPAGIDGCRDLLAIAFAENVTMSDTFERACREADRKAALRPESPRTARARRLLADDNISYQRAYSEFMRDRPAREATIDALVYSLRRGVNALTQQDTQRRLSELGSDQLEAVCLPVQAFKPNVAPAWSADDADLLISAWRKFREQR